MKIQVNAKQLHRFVQKYNTSNSSRIERIVRLLTTSVERESKISITELRAVDTGLLRSSIGGRTYGRGTGISAIVTPRTNYAEFVHEGLGTNRAYGRRPYMEYGAKRTIEKEGETVRDIIGQDISKFIKYG